MDYSELKATVENWVNQHDSGFTGQIDTFIDLAEAEMGRELHVGDNECVTTRGLTEGDQRIGLPVDWGGARKVTYISTDGTREACEHYPLRAHEEVEAALQEYVDGPRRYTIVDNAIWLIPEASITGDSLELVYYFRVPALSDSNTTNWIIEESPELYLYLTLHHAYVFMRNLEVAGNFRVMAYEIMDRMHQTDSDERWGGPIVVEVR